MLAILLTKLQTIDQSSMELEIISIKDEWTPRVQLGYLKFINIGCRDIFIENNINDQGRWSPTSLILK